MSDQEIAAEVLEKAADVLETHGWHQGNYTDGQGFCAMGAIRMATGGKVVQFGRQFGVEEWDRAQTWAARRALLDHLHVVGVDYIPAWNDHPLRTADEVIDALKEAAKDLRNQAVPDA